MDGVARSSGHTSAACREQSCPPCSKDEAWVYSQESHCTSHPHAMWHLASESLAQARPPVRPRQKMGSPTVSQDQGGYKGSSKAAGAISLRHRRQQALLGLYEELCALPQELTALQGRLA